MTKGFLKHEIERVDVRNTRGNSMNYVKRVLL